MRLFIAGATGFVGQNLLTYKKFAGHELFCLARPDSQNLPVSPQNRVRIHGGTVHAKDIKGYDGVLFLAGRAHVMRDNSADPLEENRKVNRDLAISVAKAAIEAGVPKFVYLSSVKAFGEATPKGKIVDETYPSAPQDPYGISKLEAEAMLADLYKGSAAQCVALRLPMVYGPMNKGNMALLLNSASCGRRLPLGAATGKRSMLYAGNLCDAVTTILEKKSAPGFSLYYLTDGDDMTSAQLYGEISSAYGGRDGVYYLPEPIFRLAGAVGSFLEKLFSISLPVNGNIVSRLFGELRFLSEKFRRDYGWDAPFSPREGIGMTVEWHRKHGDRLRITEAV